MKRIAFTLAEVLITLAIIGIVVAMVIPSLMNKISYQENVVVLKKTYSILTLATNMVIAEYGMTPDKWELVDGSNVDTNRIMNMYKPYLKNIKACYSGNALCNYPDTILALNGEISGIMEWGQGIGANTFRWILSDGVYLTFDEYGGVSTRFGVDPRYNNGSSYGIFMVDVNGYKKPNQAGRDVFAFVLTSKGLLPAGSSNNSAMCSTSYANSWSGMDCAAKVLRDGTMNY